MKAARGFTLIEVTVALAVLALALGAAIKAVGDGGQGQALLRDRTLSHWVALNRVAELRLGGEFPAPGVTSGSEEMGGHAWQWRLTVAETADEDVRRLEVEVGPEGREGGIGRARLVSYVGRE